MAEIGAQPALSGYRRPAAADSLKRDVGPWKKMNDMMHDWGNLFIGLSEGIIPAYVFFAFMQHVSRRWKAQAKSSDVDGLLILRLAEVLLILFTLQFLGGFIDSVLHPFTCLGGLETLTFWVLSVVVVLPIFCASVWTHKALGRRAIKEAEKNNLVQPAR